jgi:hypothetical protein
MSPLSKKSTLTTVSFRNSIGIGLAVVRSMAKLMSLIVLSGLALHASCGWAAAPKVVITVSLSRSTLTIQKVTRHGQRKLLAPIVPVVKGSLRPGTYYPRQLFSNYRTPSGTAVLHNVVRFGRDATIRTSPYFDGWVGSRRPTTHAVVLEPATGRILYDTVKAYGLANTVIQIVR